MAGAMPSRRMRSWNTGWAGTAAQYAGTSSISELPGHGVIRDGVKRLQGRFLGEERQRKIAAARIFAIVRPAGIEPGSRTRSWHHGSQARVRA